MRSLLTLLSWSHYFELLKISDKLERNFYYQQIINENWSTPELKRQKKTSLFLRLAASKDKEGILLLAKKTNYKQMKRAMRRPFSHREMTRWRVPCGK